MSTFKPIYSWRSSHMLRQRITYMNNTVSEKMAVSRRNSVTFLELLAITPCVTCITTLDKHIRVD